MFISNFSYWERSSFWQSADFVVIGAGIVGLTTALELRARLPSARIVVLERGTLPTGASTRNAGFACFGSATELLDDLANPHFATPQAVWDLVEMRYAGLQRLRERIGDEAMDFSLCGNFELFGKQTEDRESYAHCLDKLDGLNAEMQRITHIPDTFAPLPSSSASGQGLRKENIHAILLNRSEGQIHTGKMMRRLLRLVGAADIDIFYGVQVERIEEEPSGCILHFAQQPPMLARQVAVATNGFARQLLPQIADLRPARNQVLVTKPLANLPLAGCFHYHKGYVYFRNLPENRILLGGGRHLDIEGESTSEMGTTTQIQSFLEQFLSDFVAAPCEIDYAWSGILGIGSIKRPIIERVSPRICVGVRMGGMGVAIGSLVGEQLANLVSEK